MDPFCCVQCRNSQSKSKFESSKITHPKNIISNESIHVRLPFLKNNNLLLWPWCCAVTRSPSQMHFSIFSAHPFECILNRVLEKKLCKNFEPLGAWGREKFTKCYTPRKEKLSSTVNVLLKNEIFATFSKHLLNTLGSKYQLAPQQKKNVDIIVVNCCLMACKLCN